MIDSVAPADNAGSELRVRPYVLTEGRADSEIELALEAVLAATDQGRALVDELHLEREELVRTCLDAMSLTELAARLQLPIQVTRVLAGDLIAEGLLQVASAAAFAEDRPDLGLLERVLDGLQSL